MRVYGPLHLTNKAMVKKQFTQWYAGRFAANLIKGNKETFDLRISVR